MTRKPHQHCKFPVLLLLMLAPFGNNVSAQQVENADFSSDAPGPAAASSPESNTQGFYSGPVIPTTALTSPARVLNKLGENPNGKQIRISIRFLTVEPEARAAIYRLLDSGNTQKSAVTTANAPAAISLDGLESEIRSAETITARARDVCCHR